MGRAWRIEFEGALYHVMSRGNEGRSIFLDDSDRQVFLKLLGEISDRFEREFDPSTFLMDVSKRLKCDLISRRAASRVTDRDKENRDLLIYALWNTGTMTNAKIGDLFGISYSAVSHCVRSTRLKLANNRQYKNKFDKINSLFKT